MDRFLKLFSVVLLVMSFVVGIVACGEVDTVITEVDIVKEPVVSRKSNSINDLIKLLGNEDYEKREDAACSNIIHGHRF